MNEPHTGKKMFPVFAIMFGALACVAVWVWHATTASLTCQVLNNQTQTCAGTADIHNISAIVAVIFVCSCVACALRRY